jgi:hypothetical protein
MISGLLKVISYSLDSSVINKRNWAIAIGYINNKSIQPGYYLDSLSKINLWFCPPARPPPQYTLLTYLPLLVCCPLKPFQPWPQ